ncbi:MAG: hypothetical protein RML57_13255 [Acidobacteriota bacterium]|nr:hypothetical protein [Acidobacteriota bacterium]
MLVRVGDGAGALGDEVDGEALGDEAEEGVGDGDVAWQAAPTVRLTAKKLF